MKCRNHISTIYFTRNKELEYKSSWIKNYMILISSVKFICGRYKLNRKIIKKITMIEWIVFNDNLWVEASSYKVIHIKDGIYQEIEWKMNVYAI